LAPSEDLFSASNADGWLEPCGFDVGKVSHSVELDTSESLLASLNLPGNQLITPQIKVLLGKVQKNSIVKENPISSAQLKNDNYLAFGGSSSNGGGAVAQHEMSNQQDSKPKKGKQVVPYSFEKMAAPWISPETAQITNSNVKLHNEILEFCWFIEPKEEERLRQKGALEE
jgi:hypothetical protein